MTVFRISLCCKCCSVGRPTRIQIRVHRQQSDTRGTRAGTGSASGTSR